MTIQLVHYLPYSISGVPNEVNTFIQTIDRMVLLTINSSYLVVQHMDLRQELSPYGGGILGIPLAPHLALPLFQLEQSSLQQTVQRTRYPLCQFVIKERRAKEAPVKSSVALQQVGSPNSLSLDQVVVPEVLEVVRQSLRRMILSPSIDSHQGRVMMVPVPDRLRQRRTASLNRLGSHQPSVKPTARLPHLLWSMDKHRQSMRRTLKGRDYRCQYVLVGVLNGGEVVLAAGHWCSGCEKVKSEFDGNQSVSAVPS
jgi:hypothetical protein